MDNTSVIQVRIPETVRKAAEKRALEVGFSSVQEAIRLFLHGFIKKQVDVEFVSLSKQAKKRYAAIERDLDQGENTRSFNDPEAALSWLTQEST